MRISPLYLGIAALILGTSCSEEKMFTGIYRGNLRGNSAIYSVDDKSSGEGSDCWLKLKLGEEEYITVCDLFCDNLIDRNGDCMGISDHDPVHWYDVGSVFCTRDLKQMDKIGYYEELLAEGKKELYDPKVPEVLARRRAQTEAKKKIIGNVEDKLK
ncbi:MAG: hypothetical protein WCV90_02255 [Candidatus Woesearchaeota archaeon]|jgi:hypothetical protein